MARAKELIENTFLAFLNLIYPKQCQGCGIALHYKNKFYLCKECLKKIKINKPPFCIKCSNPLYGPDNLKALCGSCLTTTYNFDRAFFCCNYEGLIKELIHKFKYNRKKYLIYLFNELMNIFTKNYMHQDNPDMVVPVPLHRGRIQQRTFDQSLLLSKNIAKIFNAPIVYNVLIRNRDTAQQINLNKLQRLNNIKDAFSVRCKNVFNKKRVLLIDDVFTTGATANECAKVLKKSGADSVFLLTLAREL